MNALQLFFHGACQLNGGRSWMWLGDGMRKPRLETHVLGYRSGTVAQSDTHTHKLANDNDDK